MKWLWPDFCLGAGLCLSVSVYAAPSADTLSVQYRLEDSAAKHCPAAQRRCYLSSLTLTSPDEVAASDWSIYFSQLTPVYQVEGDEFVIRHINGDLHQLSPGPGFNGLKAGQGHRVSFYSKGSQITRSEFMPNFVLLAAGEAKVITSTQLQHDPETGLERQPYLAPFDSAAQFLLDERDKTPLADGEWLYDYYAGLASLDGEQTPTSQTPALIPMPVQMKAHSGDGIAIASGFRLKLEAASTDEAARMSASMDAALSRLASLGFKPSPTGVPLVVSLMAADSARLVSPEGYRLDIEASGIRLEGDGEAGLFYGLQSLAGLIAPAEGKLPLVSINDSPRYAFRGMHVDLARNFHSLAFLERLIVQMGAYKLNKLHLHLADDEGWRLEIPGLPELTEIGGRRCFDLDENRCLLPQLGSGISGSSQVDGYLSVADYRRLLRLATAHHIQLIPSLDMPGHSRAAIQAMEARYRRLMVLAKDAEANEYLLTEFTDTTQYQSIQYYKDNTLNVCLESTYRFVGKVVDEIAAMHSAEGVPLSLYHIGADETAGAWVESPACQALRAKEPQIHSLNGYFIEKVSAMLAKRNIRVAGWNDGMGETRPELMPREVQSNAWSLLAEEGHQVAHRQMNLGWQVVISTPQVTYFDFPYVSHPEETGNHWATRALDSFKVFSFMPDNLPAHAEFWTDVRGQAYRADDKEPLLPGKKAAGLQGQLWSEMIRSDAMAEYMIYPRMLALAERAWRKADWELEYQSGRHFSRETSYFDKARQQARSRDWQGFANALGQREFAKLEKAGIFYRIAPPGIKIEPGVNAAPAQLHLNHPYPGTRLEYRLDGGDWQPWTAPVAVSGKNVEARAIGADGKRRSRSEQLRL